ncbi:GL14937 [Drosophila persimilis]|uniref:GL14937 n=1 Tax=Drosophila persimilis TaxID=7234 RepID=B4H068_DROPE|nr:GL14937 [Drosophila persimilis]
MAFYGGVNTKGYFIPLKELTKGIKATQLKTANGKCPSEKSGKLSNRFKEGTSQRSPTIPGCTFQLTPKSDRVGSKKMRPKEDFHKDKKSSPLSSSGKEVKKKLIKKIKTVSPGSSASCGNPRKSVRRSLGTKNSSGSSTPGKTFRKSQPNAEKTRKSPASSSSGSNRKKNIHKSSSSSSLGGTFNKDSRMNMKGSPEMKKPMSSPYSKAVFRGISRMNRKKQSSESCKSTSTDEGFHGSKLIKTKQSTNLNFSPLSSYDDMNNNLMISLSPISERASSDDASPRMMRQRSSDFHVSMFDSSPDSCKSEKKPTLLDSTSDELRTRKTLLNLMHKSHLRTSTSVASMLEIEDGDTATNKSSPISQKETPKSPKENHLKRKEISQMVYQMWLKNKQREEEEQRVQNHTQLAALNASSSLKGNPITVTAAAKPHRNISKEEINQELESWRLKKIQMQKSKRQEEKLAKIKHEQDLFHRQTQSAMAIKKWFSTVHKKPKPVPMNQGIDSLRGTISDLYINPQPWMQ